MLGMKGTDPVYIMLVADVSEVPQVSFGKEHGHTQGMYGCISESLIKKPPPWSSQLKYFSFAFPRKKLRSPNSKFEKNWQLL